ncbi:protein SENSITIVE TO UV 2 isoform X3 [Quercus lobata]|uniref:protein SENSITIVE TO UV 2 isoform X3 n=1 Tax=Quercus lobata TaxID=97700 RepID=UPI001244F885|nr:protein SENSITIVE TO UV 2 isoform X3 [Quercus lobata]
METMSEEGFEEWDADFLDQLIHVEELALTSTKQQQQQQPLRTTSSSSSQTHHYINNPTNTNTMMSYSPPRQLSQRVSFDDKQLEIDMLKRELGHVSKQLTDLEQECLELRKERGKKEEQLQIFSKNEVKDVDARSSKSTTFCHNGREYGALNHHRVRQKFQNAISLNIQAGSQIDRAMPAYKAIGIQTEKAGDPGQVTMDVDPAACQALTEKLLAIWGSPRDQKLGRNLINKLLVTCQTDFHVLFAWMSVSVPKRTMDSLKDGSLSDVALTSHLHSFHTPEAAKVSHLYSVLTKVVIVHRSLCILRVFLKHLLSLERKSERRDNVTVGGLLCGSNIVDFNGLDRVLSCASRNEKNYAGYTPLGIRLPNAEIPCMEGPCNRDIAISVSCVDWVSLFEAMHQIIVRNTEECVRLEAVSVMIVILMRSNAYMEREKFGKATVFESLSQLLRKEAGLRVQRHAVHLLYLLLNCPKLLVMFCSGSNEGGTAAVPVDDDARPQKFIKVLQGLADCVACSGNGIQELTLRRNAITVLAFLASSGKPGFEIFVRSKLYREANFLMLILQVLVSEIDIEETAVCVESPEIFKERTLLIREALILLNRLVSNPAYSVTVLWVLTNSRDMASLTIDIATRLSWEYQRHGHSDCITRQMRESEIVNLARVFRKRVFTYLGHNIS